MAKYLIRESAFVQGKYFQADVRNPLVIELPADVEPSLKWEPVDTEARSALKALVETKKEKQKEVKAGVEQSELINRVKLDLVHTEPEAKSTAVSSDEPTSMSDLQSRNKPKRASDKDHP